MYVVIDLISTTVQLGSAAFPIPVHLTITPLLQIVDT